MRDENDVKGEDRDRGVREENDVRGKTGTGV